MESRQNPRRYCKSSLGTAALLIFAAQSCVSEAPPTTALSKKDEVLESSVDGKTVRATNAAIGVRFSFHYSDYHTLTSPNIESCAGDARTFYHPVDYATASGYVLKAGEDPAVVAPTGFVAVTGATGPVPFGKLSSTEKSTTKPSFLKNVSVDMTDANASVPNNAAFTCSMGSGPSAPPNSSCASFDYGAIGGIPTTLGGTMLIIGGIQRGVDLPGDTTGATFYNDENVTQVTCGPAAPESTISIDARGERLSSNCTSSIYALGIDSLPATAANADQRQSLAPGLTSVPKEPISTWARLKGATGASGPDSVSGAALAYSPSTQKVLVYGGISPLAGMGPTGPASDTRATWTYDVKEQTWARNQAVPYTANSLAKIEDPYKVLVPASGATAAHYEILGNAQIDKSGGARSLFGYVAVQNNALASLTTNGIVATANLDNTERIMIVGGLGADDVASRGTYRFNPTFGPDLVDSISADQTARDPTTLGSAKLYPPLATTGRLVHSLSSFHTSVLNNTDEHSQFRPPYAATREYCRVDSNNDGNLNLNDPILQCTDGLALNFGMVAVRALAAGLTTGTQASIGGFDISVANVADLPDGGGGKRDPTTHGEGVFAYGSRALGAMGSIAQSANFTSFPNAAAPQGGIERLIPIYWNYLAEQNGNSLKQLVPWFGGVSAVPGFNLTNNHIVYFGGTSCRDFIADDTVTNCRYDNPGRYWQFGDAYFDGRAVTEPSDQQQPTGNTQSMDPPAKHLPVALSPASSSAGWGSGTDAPIRAGLATARGRDNYGRGRIVILAYGGMAVNTSGTSTDMNVLYNAGTRDVPTPTWVKIPAAGGPPGLTSAQMVYSHATGKFYLFGGYETAPSRQMSGDTWELTVNGTCPGCSFSWRQLNTGGNSTLTCYPDCPRARRAHRMVEVNYWNYDPNHEPDRLDEDGSNPIASRCSGTEPCSYGIFMEGGTSDGINKIADRWMFDPTANGGRGHWQEVGGFPPRRLAALASVSFKVPALNQSVSRAILFGGETGLHNPEMALNWSASASAPDLSVLIPPTLGDTFMYDYENDTWNRVDLLGKGYLGTYPDSVKNSQYQVRQAYRVNSGAMQHVTGYNDKKSEWGTSAVSSDPNAATHVARPELSQLSPPALAGHLMATRLFPGPLKAAAATLDPLAIPQVFLFGGRGRDGKYFTLNNVWKFCAGTTGEKPRTVSRYVNNTMDAAEYLDDASCDAFDANSNSASPGPIGDYVGRWLRKSPAGFYSNGDPFTTSEVGSYLGATAYDPTEDRLMLFGGLTFTGMSNAAVTDASRRTTSNFVYQYIPPSRVNPTDSGTTVPPLPVTSPAIDTSAKTEGRWLAVPPCINATYDISGPTGRYGHSMSYDPLSRALIVVGGYSLNGDAKQGQPLKTLKTYTDPISSIDYYVPEVWTATLRESGPYVVGKDSAGKDIVANLTAGIFTGDGLKCYLWKKKTVFGNSPFVEDQKIPSNLAHAAGIFIPASGYNTGFYSMFDDACGKAGPINTGDNEVSKLLAGGAYIDIDRSQLGPNENLILNLTYAPLGTVHQSPSGARFKENESAVLRVHLVRTGLTADALQRMLQPRHLAFAATDQYPHVVHTMSVLAPPVHGGVRQEQLLLPISIDPSIDRIRIERYSGSAILIDASIYRMGYR